MASWISKRPRSACDPLRYRLSFLALPPGRMLLNGSCPSAQCWRLWVTDLASLMAAWATRLTQLMSALQVTRLKKELERVEAERTRAQEDARRCDLLHLQHFCTMCMQSCRALANCA